MTFKRDLDVAFTFSKWALKLKPLCKVTPSTLVVSGFEEGDQERESVLSIVRCNGAREDLGDNNYVVYWSMFTY